MRPWDLHYAGIDIAILKSDIHVLHFAMLAEILNDFSIFNRFPKLKESGKGVRIHASEYNRGYYKELLEDLDGDFIRGICMASSLKHEEFVADCMTRTDMLDVGPERFEAMAVRKKRFSSNRGTLCLSRKVDKATLAG